MPLTQYAKIFKEWLFKQAPIIILLVVIAIVQAWYLTNQIVRIQKLYEKSQERLINK